MDWEDILGRSFKILASLSLMNLQKPGEAWFVRDDVSLCCYLFKDGGNSFQHFFFQQPSDTLKEELFIIV